MLSNQITVDFATTRVSCGLPRAIPRCDGQIRGHPWPGNKGGQGDE